MPAATSDAGLELQSIPMDDPVPAGSPPWDQAPEDMGLTRQFSENAGTWAASPPAAAAGAGESRDSLDFSVPGAVRGPAKVEFSSADFGGFHPDLARGSGDLSGAGNELILAPPGPIPQIASPEPTVTALWGISALFFVCRRKVRSRS